MNEMYNTIEKLCIQRGIKVGRMAVDAKVSKSTMSELKKGRTNNLSAETLNKIADYFDVTVDFLLGKQEKTAILSDDGLNAEFTSLFSQIGAVEQNIVLSQIKGILLAKEL